MKPMMRTTILGSDKQFRDEIISYLEDNEKVYVTGTYPLEWDLLKIIEQEHPNLIIILTPEKITSDFKTVIRKIAKTKGLNILALLNRIDPCELLQLLLCGVNGFQTISQWREQLIESVRMVTTDGICIPPLLAKKMIDFLRNPVLEEKSKKLTSKEFQVLSEIRKGRSYREVAEFFNIGESTIRTHCKSIYRKLGVRGRIEAINMVFLNPGVIRSPLLPSTG